MIESLREILSVPVDAVPLALFRCLLGIIIVVNLLKNWNSILKYYTRSSYYLFFEWTPFVRPLKKMGMQILMWSIMILSCCFVLGFIYPYCAIFLCLCSFYVLFIDKAAFSHENYLICLLLLLFSFVDGARGLSLDSFLFQSSFFEQTVPYGHILIIKLQCLIAFSFSGINKITYEFLIKAVPLRQFLKGFIWSHSKHYKNFSKFVNRRGAECTERFFNLKYTPIFLAWTVMLVETFSLSFMFFESTYYLGLISYLLYHLFKYQFFSRLGFYLNLSALILFLKPSVINQLTHVLINFYDNF